jgi:arylsulfatase A-like enzyme
MQADEHKKTDRTGEGRDRPGGSGPAGAQRPGPGGYSGPAEDPSAAGGPRTPGDPRAAGDPHAAYSPRAPKDPRAAGDPRAASDPGVPGGPRAAGGLDRRTFISRGLIAGGALVGGGLAISKLADATAGTPDAPAPPPNLSKDVPKTSRRAARVKHRPNILVVMVDQLRTPQWIGAEPTEPGALTLPPNVQRLREGGVYFERHYTASNDCTPARSALLTGLYTHQTGCLITGGSTLNPAFPTWGSMLREHGYHTRWYGKWHLTHGDGNWTPFTGPAELARYGFAGGTYPSPDGGPGQGWRVDPAIATQFEQWYAGLEEADPQPWCATVSFVDPHDIAWWYGWTNRVAAESYAPAIATELPPNFQTPEQLAEQRKPRLQRSLQETAAASFGAVPFTGPEAAEAWLGMLDLYVKLQLQVDEHVGQVLDALESRPRIAENTVVVFTSDHGEYLGSHGLRGKGAGAYEEAIKVPLIVKDPRGLLTSEPEATRTQLTSSVDVAPLLLSIGSGGDAWRRERRYSHLAHRLDLAAILANPAAPGRPYVVHATDEIVTEFAVEPYSASAPLHVVALRTEEAKYGLYANWADEQIRLLDEGQESELYDYGTHGGRLETTNSAGQNETLEGSMRELMAQAFVQELRRPLPARLQVAHGRGFANYFTVATRAALHAAERRAEQEELVAAALSSHFDGGRVSDRRARRAERLYGNVPRGHRHRHGRLKPAAPGARDRRKRARRSPG